MEDIIQRKDMLNEKAIQDQELRGDDREEMIKVCVCDY